MGVPGFFMWLWKRYKGTNFVFDKSKLNKKKDQILIQKVDSIDYFLIDTNCMIHPVCFKTLADHNNITNKTKLENKMMDEVLIYLEKMIKYVNPKKGVYIAIDGVAPVAKIKQQRSRRFKSVHDRALWENIKKKHNKEVPNSWNNSAITPGTEFMRLLNIKIIEWCKKQNLEILYSSCNTPSEGEHKLLQFIRDNNKNNKKFSYVIYGLDADLIFLALTTGLRDVFLLREAVHLNKNQSTEVLNYVWMEKMRESVNVTISDLVKIKLDDDDIENVVDEERVINDFIFICYLLGNDFLPHLPSLDISKNGLDYLLEYYVECLMENNFNYIINKNNKEIINQDVFYKLMGKLAEDEDSIITENFNRKKRRYRSQSSDPYDKEMHKIENLMFKVDDPIKLGSDNSELWEKRYYNHYFGVEDDYESFIKEMCKHYLTGLKWVTLYYFDKCVSWNWYFPYDHPPFLKSIYKYSKTFKFKDIKLELGKPLKPYVQLMCVLPPQSSFLVPKKLQKPMTNPNSSLAHLYPTDFKQDFIGKHRYWMGIPYLPQLEINLVNRTFRKYEKIMDEKELFNNRQIEIYKFN
jgi:5'-3' exonuclease